MVPERKDNRYAARKESNLIDYNEKHGITKKQKFAHLTAFIIYSI